MHYKRSGKPESAQPMRLVPSFLFSGVLLSSRQRDSSLCSSPTTTSTFRLFPSALNCCLVDVCSGKAATHTHEK
ncbi:hypothetical protein EYF80_046789 [Liparis tanakae]|uniref:Uncharacterized protein n=1 Tax=Liparis tanakae TaxID=230148 RepID=A0A4Z2FPD5_9TELE|nr:hypothetical protein EYF80_046789 [Liparis tanakae]